MDLYAFCLIHVFAKPKRESEVFSDLLCGLKKIWRWYSRCFHGVKEISSFNKRSKKPSFHGSKGRLGSGS